MLLLVFLFLSTSFLQTVIQRCSIPGQNGCAVEGILPQEISVRHETVSGAYLGVRRHDRRATTAEWPPQPITAMNATSCRRYALGS